MSKLAHTFCTSSWSSNASIRWIMLLGGLAFQASRARRFHFNLCCLDHQTRGFELVFDDVQLVG